MRLGMSSAAFYGRMNTEEAAECLQHFPIETCEIFLQTFSEYTGTFGRTVREYLGALRCTSVHPKGTQFEQDLFAPYERQRNDAMSLFRGICEAGAALGASFYVLHGPPGFQKEIHPHQIRLIRTVYPQMQQIAADYGMEILWENVSWCACRLPEDVGALLELFPQQRFVLDIKQAYLSGINPLEMAEVMGSHLAHVHVLDWDQDGHLLLPGEGVFDFQALAALLRTIDFHGAVILEPYSSQAADEERVKRSLNYLHKVIAQP